MQFRAKGGNDLVCGLLKKWTLTLSGGLAIFNWYYGYVTMLWYS